MPKSKADFALPGEHFHYFNKKVSLDIAANPKCKVCGGLLPEYKTQKNLRR